MNYKTQRNKEKLGKFEPNWEKPYVVIDTFGSSIYQLATLEGKPLLYLPTTCINKSIVLNSTKCLEKMSKK